MLWCAMKKYIPLITLFLFLISITAYSEEGKFARWFLKHNPFTSSKSKNRLKKFETDGCSMWIDKLRITGDSDWTHCCIQHDIRYFGGGTSTERLAADEELQLCIEDTGAVKMAKVMFDGVRMGGAPQSITYYRWGYGWKKNRFYKELSPAQQEMVDHATDNVDIYDTDQIIDWWDLKARLGL